MCNNLSLCLIVIKEKFFNKVIELRRGVEIAIQYLFHV